VTCGLAKLARNGFGPGVRLELLRGVHKIVNQTKTGFMALST
jgi:hypothetical protein